MPRSQQGLAGRTKKGAGAAGCRRQADGRQGQQAAGSAGARTSLQAQGPSVCPGLPVLPVLPGLWQAAGRVPQASREQVSGGCQGAVLRLFSPQRRTQPCVPVCETCPSMTGRGAGFCRPGPARDVHRSGSRGEGAGTALPEKVRRCWRCRTGKGHVPEHRDTGKTGGTESTGARGSVILLWAPGCRRGRKRQN